MIPTNDMETCNVSSVTEIQVTEEAKRERFNNGNNLLETSNLLGTPLSLYKTPMLL